MKTCSTCGETKSLSDFYRRAASSDGLAPNCKGCRKDAKAAWLLNHPERFREMQRKAALKRNYGLLPVDFDALLKKQNGGCAICNSSKPGGKGNFHVDHDHETGQVRGLLCADCNMGLGKFKDNIDVLKAATSYLRRFK